MLPALEVGYYRQRPDEECRMRIVGGLMAASLLFGLGFTRFGLAAWPEWSVSSKPDSSHDW